MIRVTAPSRLHFGSFSLPCASPGRTFWPDREGSPTIPARHFGGVGLMINRPGVELTVELADELIIEGQSANRAYEFARRAAASLHLSDRLKFRIVRCPPDHVGLGTGTQLALAVGYTLVVANGVVDWLSSPVEQIAKTLGRGERSALGIHGFAAGGFLVEGGKTVETAIAPLVCRREFPADWLVLLVIPGGLRGTHGAGEGQAFASLAGAKPDLRRTEALTRLVLLGMLPALVTRDLDAFGEALYDFNRRVGEMYAPWQGGIYSHPRIAEIVGLLRKLGARGVGQSSWGPTVFAIVTADQAHDISDRLVREHDILPEELILTEASRGVVVREE
jgi:beta-RFAP synthase